MSNEHLTHALTQTVERLSEPESLNDLCHRQQDGNPLPSGKVLEEIIDLSRAILFPGYYGKSSIHSQTIQYQIGVSVVRLHSLLTDQILAGICFCEDCGSENGHESLSCRRQRVGDGRHGARLQEIQRELRFFVSIQPPFIN